MSKPLVPPGQDPTFVPPGHGGTPPGLVACLWGGGTVTKLVPELVLDGDRHVLEAMDVPAARLLGLGLPFARGMTAIAYKSGIVAADSAIWVGGTIVGHQRKIARRVTKLGVVLLAGGGDPAVVEWFLANGATFLRPRHAKLPKPSDQSFSGLIVLNAKRIDAVTVIDANGYATTLTCPFYAGGRAAELLTGVMVAGGGAVQAVKAAIHWTDSAAGDVHAESFNGEVRA